jgi:hypothetical protein
VSGHIFNVEEFDLVTGLIIEEFTPPTTNRASQKGCPETVLRKYLTFLNR